jgi:16S rRNA (guanine966-N2)-methyltransferase
VHSKRTPRDRAADKPVSGDKAAGGVGKIRIIAGEYRGRRIAVPLRPGVRPTPDRVRETLFNWLGQWLDGLACLDLFAGSGALGFEAASRGAARVVMVENDRAAFANLESTRKTIDARQVELVFGDAADYVKRVQDRFDLVFLDPPFRQNALAPMLERLPERLAPGARVYVEAAAPVEMPAPWRLLKQAQAGQVSYQLLEWPGAVTEEK